ncbi:MAG TPA: FIST N-terminal domain-containing protein [Thermoanaerobaculia bacterium]|nr:FIST N-terminal domain-containing protein [Thermoanaerobaculia bacterium]
MKSAVLSLGPVVPSPRELIERLRDLPGADGSPPAGEPSFVLAFLPPADQLPATLAALAAAFPGSLRFGCEAVTQFAGDGVTGQGSLQLFWFERPEHRVEVTAIHGARGRDLEPEAVARAVAALDGADAAFLLSDGLRFPAWQLLDALRDGLPQPALPVVGGLASQVEPIEEAGARVFVGEEVLDSACLLAAFHGIEMAVEVVRGWDPASPIFTVTGARDDVLYSIDGEPAASWYRRFFTVDGELAPMPESAHRFPLIIEGPRPERRDLYRSMKTFDDPPGAVTFWGDLEPGDQVRLGMGNDASLLRTAGRLQAALAPEAAVLYSCVGREVVLGALAAREASTIQSALPGASLGGFFTFGEIGPAAGGGGLAFYNQTAVLALLRERLA